MSTGGIPSRSPRHAAALNGSTADNEEEFSLGWPSTFLGVNMICEPGASHKVEFCPDPNSVGC